MDDYVSSDDDYHYSDPDDFVDGFDNDETDYQLVTPKGPSTQVFDFLSSLFHHSYENTITCFWGIPNFSSFSLYLMRKR